jgi:transcriptional regulator with PAS, ATPase and Fis domain
VTHQADHLFPGAWIDVLDQLGEAIIVLDHQRTLRHVNESARRLLGYEKGHEIGGRCKLTTQGVDCENACPLTFALNNDLQKVEDFATVYHTVDGRALPLRITVIPLSGEEGEFVGAVEILRPTEPNPGYLLAGSSSLAEGLRERAASLARDRADICIVGDPPACRDVALAIHRFSGMPENLFKVWTGSWETINPWPPGTVYADEDQAESLLESSSLDGWRVIIGNSEGRESPSLETLELPSAEDLTDDLPRIIVTWIGALSPRTRVEPAALDQLTRMARDRGFGELEKILTAALAASDGLIEVGHLPVDGYGTALVDELLQAPRPLAALEKRMLCEVLERCGWRMQEAADRVGVSRVTLWRKMKDLGIEKGS